MIRRLPTHLVDRIAAGEVVERPASVVKELVENSLDSGATRIEIMLDEAGLRSIAVTDNGGGMTPDDMRLALERHATSKLPGDDLLAISWFGFRGEALPAIASVSRLSIESRPGTADSGWRLTGDGGELLFDGPCGRAPGTRVLVEDLFGRVPARRKFLKSPRAEIAAVADVVRRLAMAHPRAAFRLVADGRRLIDVAAEEGDGIAALAARVGRLLPAGSEVAPIDWLRDDCSIGGMAGLPAASRATGEHQYLFVNGRPVKDRQLVGALRGAYRDRLPGGRHALAAIFIDLPPAQVDVNVHPAKAEVRFREPARIRGALISAIRTALDEAGTRPVANSALATRFEPIAPRQAEARSSPATLPFAPPVRATAPSANPAPSPLVAEPQPEPWHMPSPAGAAADLPLGRARGQIANTYIIAESADALVLVDQHAAHERLVLEELRAARADAPPPTQALLIPEPVTLDPVAADALEEAAAELMNLGLELDRFGPDCMLVRKVPAALGQTAVAPLVIDVAEALLAGDGASPLADRLDSIAATIACHGSVRAGRALSLAEMDSLLRQMEANPASGTCNHGRPTAIRLGKDDLARLFDRR